MFDGVRLPTGVFSGMSYPAAETVARSETSVPFKSSALSTSTEKLSVLARQLSDSAGRAESREKGLSRNELQLLSYTLQSQISGSQYYDKQDMHDNEIPKVNDPELLERARQATDYVRRTALGDNNALNPFAGLSRDQLSLIEFDDSGAFTINERVAAAYGYDKIEFEWECKVTTEAMAESEAKGKTPQFLQDVLDHYKALPLMEQVSSRYPGNYEEIMLERIQDEENRAPDPREGQMLSLFELLAKALPTRADASKSSSPQKSASEPPPTTNN